MCGRFTQHYSRRRFMEFMRLVMAPPGEFDARYNIAPTQLARVVTQHGSGTREARMMRWGLVPYWAKKSTTAGRLINARAETLHDKPAFRAAVSKRRCIVPVSGFYEWKMKDENKQPYYIRGAVSDVLLLAGLWEKWSGGDGERPCESPNTDELETFAIITTAPNAMMSRLHDRMPAILTHEQAERWLDCQSVHATQSTALLGAVPEDTLVCHPVSTRVNSPRIDDARLIEPLKSAGGGLFSDL